MQGVRSAFTLQKRVREDVNSFVRGIRAVEQSAMSSELKGKIDWMDE